MDGATLELVKLLGGAAGLGVFCTFVALQLRDQTRLLGSISRKLARTEVLTIGTFESVTGRRVQRAQTSPFGVPSVPSARPHTDSDDPGVAVARTMTDDP